ncbi:MAG TPA: phosphate signaling complex protein PhoU [Vicinamibacteria bacterium]|nr:phosphate signaling complex protein PhoU [Vicinamibacteria bacterium]
MTHYEIRLAADLKRIRDGVERVAELVEKALRDAMRALLTMDKGLAYRTIIGDMPVNRSVKEIDRLCHQFVARHLPSAGHLRFISSVLRMNVELERIGDYAVTICRETVQLTKPLSTGVRREAERLSKDTFQMLHQSLQAFHESNADLARATMTYSDQLDRRFDMAFEALVEEGDERTRPIRDLFETLVIFNRLERVGDQAKNICEETVFAVTGETKPPKIYRILFLDRANDYRSQMAAAIARKAYPESGRYKSAGLEPAERLDPGFVQFMEEQGMDMQDHRPQPIDWVPEEWSSFHVLVSLEGPIERYLPEVPFRTVALEWEVPPAPVAEASETERRERFEETFRLIAIEVRDLMETLRGEEAS